MSRKTILSLLAIDWMWVWIVNSAHALRLKTWGNRRWLTSTHETVLQDDGSEMVMTLVVLFLGKKKIFKYSYVPGIGLGTFYTLSPHKFLIDSGRKVLLLSIF